mmetsp:Transcript_111371/g.311247  ORF Transcript_111371/g.311247 Transcript_111371/m.311247 type:complete len:297 (+) Transcript_111371:57-947(+)
MKETGELLKEREVLQKENTQIEQGLRRMLGDNVEADPSESAEANAVFPGDELAAIERLLPLVDEGESLQAEHDKLCAERGDLLSSLSTFCGGASPSQSAGSRSWSGGNLDDEAAASEHADIEVRLRGAVEQVRGETLGLEAEVQQLREDNARLKEEQLAVGLPPPIDTSQTPARRTSGPAPVCTPSPPRRISIQPGSPNARRSNKALHEKLTAPPPYGWTLQSANLPPLSEEEMHELQRTATERLLRRQVERASTTPKAATLELHVREPRTSAEEKEREGEFAVREGLTRMFRGFR